MSIASELSALNGYILGAYDEINGKGGTVPANKNMANLASAISSISSGTPTTITPLQVTENGTYTAPTGTAYSPVTVNVSGGGGISGLYTGVVTIADESAQTYITISEAFPKEKGQPKLCILYEMNTAENDTGTDTSRTRFPKYFIAKRGTATSSGTGASKESYHMSYHAIQFSGSSYSSDDTNSSVKGMFYQKTSALNYNVYSFCGGSAGTGNLYFGTGGTYGLRTGRSYRWMVIIDSELDA